MSVYVKAQGNEPVDKMLRRFKRNVERAGTLHELRARRYHEKSSKVRRRKKDAAIFRTMLRQRYRNL